MIFFNKTYSTLPQYMLKPSYLSTNFGVYLLPVSEEYRGWRMMDNECPCYDNISYDAVGEK